MENISNTFYTISLILMFLQLIINIKYFHTEFMKKINHAKEKSNFIKNSSLPTLIIISLYILFLFKNNINSFESNKLFYSTLFFTSIILLFVLSIKIYKTSFTNTKLNVNVISPNDTLEIIEKLSPLFISLRKEELINDDLNLNDFKKEIEEKNLKINFGANEIYYLYNKLDFSITLEKFIQHFKNNQGKNFNYGSTRNAKAKILNDSREKIDRILKNTMTM